MEIQSSPSTGQHGFQRGLSCETQLITVIHEWACVLNIYGQGDVIFLDFANAFDTVPHDRLLLKAKFYGISGNLNYWLRAFFTGRRQRVMVNGASSKWAPGLFGVPQGIVLGPILFRLFINDLPSSVSSSVKLFADNSVLYRHKESSADHDELQQDLLQLEEWAAMWPMNFDPRKCYIMSITLERQPSSFSYTLGNSPLEGVTLQKYLGVYITNSFNWTKQAMEVKKKANTILGVLQRNLSSSSAVVKERAYLFLVRPICEYGSVAWSPCTQKDIICVESVQRRAARFVCNDYCRCFSVNTMLSNLGWHDLETRRKITDLTMFFKIKTRNIRISFPNDLREVHSTRSSSSVTHLPLTRTSILFSSELFPLGTLCLLFPYVLIPLLCSIQVIMLCFDDFYFIFFI